MTGAGSVLGRVPERSNSGFEGVVPVRRIAVRRIRRVLLVLSSKEGSMKSTSRERCSALSCAFLSSVFVLTTAAGAAAGPLVLTGWDLLATQAGTQFLGVAFAGVPLGTFDFGAGPVGVGNTDTIIQRLDTADAPTDSIGIEMVALGLVSTTPVDLGGGLGLHYITLQSARGGPDSLGRMTINFGPEGTPHGTFDSFFDVFFDLRLGDPSGPIVLSDTLRLAANDVPWGHLPPPGALEIPFVNVFLNQQNRDADFWPIGVFQEEHPDGGVHAVTTAAPEPATIALLGLGLLIPVLRRARRGRS
jgi:hypothetical protein